jgi:hypothetical protein
MRCAEPADLGVQGPAGSVCIRWLPTAVTV